VPSGGIKFGTDQTSLGADKDIFTSCLEWKEKDGATIQRNVTAGTEENCRCDWKPYE
jgi:hypothetical protein